MSRGSFGSVAFAVGWRNIHNWVTNPALIIPGIITNLLIAYPFIEAWATGDKREHHLLDRPRNAPTRTGLGVR